LAAFGSDLVDRDAVAVLGLAPTPDRGRALSHAELVEALRRAGRRRRIDARAAAIRAALVSQQLEAPAVVAAAYGRVVAAAVVVIRGLSAQVAGLEAALTSAFTAHPDAGLCRASPGLERCWVLGCWPSSATTTGQRATVRCHRWVPGTPATAVAPSPAMAADVGRSLAAIHALGLAAPETTATGLVPLSLATWHQTVTQTRRAGLPWARDLAGLTPLVEQLAERLQALQGQGRPMVLSHRDLDPKNAVVRPDLRVALLDWDYAGPTLAGSEMLVTALSFAGGTLQPDAACVGACVRGFLDAGGQVQPPDLLDTAVIHQESLSWLWLNVDRCLGRRLRDPADHQLGQRLASQLLGAFAAEVATVDRWAGRLLEQPGPSA
jgi:phosphotransferase family enzyme